MEKDKYFLKLEKEYINSRGKYPTVKELSDYVYERKQMGKEFVTTLSNFDLFNNNIITELDKGCLDTIFNSYDNIENNILVEISDYFYSFVDQDIHTIAGHVVLNKKNNIVVNSNIKYNNELGFLLDSVLKEGMVDIRNFPLYSKMYYDDIHLYIGIFGDESDLDKENKIRNLYLLKEKVKTLSNIDLEVCSNDMHGVYQKVLYNKK